MEFQLSSLVQIIKAISFIEERLYDMGNSHSKAEVMQHFFNYLL